MKDRPQILISHASEELALAQAWKDLIETISVGYIHVWLSSDASGKIGNHWLEDITHRIDDSQFTLAIQTPTSAGHPWIMWGCGVASSSTRAHSILPIIYTLPTDEIASPLKYYTLYRGDRAASVKQLCQYLIQDAQLNVSDFIYENAIKTYLESVNLHLMREGAQIQPARKGVSPEQIVVWRNRIETQVQSGRISELKGLRQMMYSSLGKQPLDFSLHDSLARLLVQRTDFALGLEEIEYALHFAPGDIPLLYLKALTLAELKQWDVAKGLIEHILTLDAHLDKNAEIASVRGRIYRERWRETGNPADLDTAIQAYYLAYQATDSYYTGINAAALALIKGDEAFGIRLAQEVLELCQQFQSQENVSYWVDFTAGEAYLALGETENALLEYERGFHRHPAPELREQNAVFSGISRMLHAKKLSSNVIDTLVEKVRSFREIP